MPPLGWAQQATASTEAAATDPKATAKVVAPVSTHTVPVVKEGYKLVQYPAEIGPYRPHVYSMIHDVPVMNIERYEYPPALTFKKADGTLGVRSAGDFYLVAGHDKWEVRDFELKTQRTRVYAPPAPPSGTVVYMMVRAWHSEVTGEIFGHHEDREHLEIQRPSPGRALGWSDRRSWCILEMLSYRSYCGCHVYVFPTHDGFQSMEEVPQLSHLGEQFVSTSLKRSNDDSHTIVRQSTASGVIYCSKVCQNSSEETASVAAAVTRKMLPTPKAVHPKWRRIEGGGGPGAIPAKPPQEDVEMAFAYSAEQSIPQSPDLLGKELRPPPPRMTPELAEWRQSTATSARPPVMLDVRSLAPKDTPKGTGLDEWYEDTAGDLDRKVAQLYDNTTEDIFERVDWFVAAVSQPKHDSDEEATGQKSSDNSTGGDDGLPIVWDQIDPVDPWNDGRPEGMQATSSVSDLDIGRVGPGPVPHAPRPSRSLAPVNAVPKSASATPAVAATQTSVSSDQVYGERGVDSAEKPFLPDPSELFPPGAVLQEAWLVMTGKKDPEGKPIYRLNPYRYPLSHHMDSIGMEQWDDNRERTLLDAKHVLSRQVRQRMVKDEGAAAIPIHVFNEDKTRVRIYASDGSGAFVELDAPRPGEFFAITNGDMEVFDSINQVFRDCGRPEVVPKTEQVFVVSDPATMEKMKEIQDREIKETIKQCQKGQVSENRLKDLRNQEVEYWRRNEQRAAAILPEKERRAREEEVNAAAQSAVQKVYFDQDHFEQLRSTRRIRWAYDDTTFRHQLREVWERFKQEGLPMTSGLTTGQLAYLDDRPKSCYEGRKVIIQSCGLTWHKGGPEVIDILNKERDAYRNAANSVIRQDRDQTLATANVRRTRETAATKLISMVAEEAGVGSIDYATDVRSFHDPDKDRKLSKHVGRHILIKKNFASSCTFPHWMEKYKAVLVRHFESSDHRLWEKATENAARIEQERMQSVRKSMAVLGMSADEGSSSRSMGGIPVELIWSELDKLQRQSANRKDRIFNSLIMCKSGRHRSVAAAEIMAQCLAEVGFDLELCHLDRGNWYGRNCGGRCEFCMANDFDQTITDHVSSLWWSPKLGFTSMADEWWVDNRQ